MDNKERQDTKAAILSGLNAASIPGRRFSASEGAGHILNLYMDEVDDYQALTSIAMLLLVSEAQRVWEGGVYMPASLFHRLAAILIATGKEGWGSNFNSTELHPTITAKRALIYGPNYGPPPPLMPRSSQVYKVVG